jgi:succinate dehydrogenase hydrophobic anchor subunit
MRESVIRLIQYILGLAVLILISFHLSLFTQFIGPGYELGLDFSTVAERMNSQFYDTVYLILLFALLTHGFIGIRNILFEVFMTSSTRRVITIIIILVYLTLLIYGVLPILAGAGNV